MKGSIHICEVKEILDRTSLPRRSEFDAGKINAPMISSKFLSTYNCRTA